MFKLGGCNAQLIRMDRLICRVDAEHGSPFFSSICLAYLDGMAGVVP